MPPSLLALTGRMIESTRVVRCLLSVIFAPSRRLPPYCCTVAVSALQAFHAVFLVRGDLTGDRSCLIESQMRNRGK
jgi:hypothetical protein